MQPTECFDKVEVSSKAKIGGAFKLLSGEIERGETHSRKQPFLRAYREGGPDPCWQFRETPETRIDGSYRFHMIVRSGSGAGARTTGTIELSTTVRRMRFMLMPYREAHADAPALDFHLAARDA